MLEADAGSDDRLFYRIGGLAGIASAAIGLVANALHPRPGPGDVGDLPKFLDLAGDYALWKVDHFAIIVTVVLGLIALVAIARSLFGGPGDAWARFALVFALATGAVAAISFTIDGLVLGAVADEWVAAGPSARDALLERARTVAYFDTAVFAVATLGLFGVTQLLYGLALRQSRVYAAWLATVAFVGAAAGLASGTWMWFSGGFNTGNFLVLFTIASLALAVWSFAASLTLYRRSRAVAS